MVVRNSCSHGGFPVSKAQMNDIRNLGADMQTMLKAKTLPKKTQRKVMARITKSISSFSSTKDPAQGTSALASLHLGWATDLLLDEKYEKASNACMNVIKMEGICWLTNTIQVDPVPAKVARQKDQLNTDQGLVLYIAKRIPCNCLNHLKKEAKKLVQEAHCWGCEERFPVSQLYYCACHVSSYCSDMCQQEDWEDHKKACAKWKKEQQEDVSKSGKQQ